MWDCCVGVWDSGFGFWDRLSSHPDRDFWVLGSGIWDLALGSISALQLIAIWDWGFGI